MTTYTYDHIHLRSKDPMATAQYFNKMFDAKILESVQTDGQSRIDIDVNGLMIFIAAADDTTPAGPVDPHLGIGPLRVTGGEPCPSGGRVEGKGRGVFGGAQGPAARAEDCLCSRTRRRADRVAGAKLTATPAV